MIMDATNPFVHDQDDSGPMPQPSPKKRKSVKKRVVSIPIGEVDGSKSKGETYPPSDSWAWRKYGQKPIKGSPYPRGYYRCSGSKGCPARKQVERSRLDPTTLVITYAGDHNHQLPANNTKHHNHNHQIQFSSSFPSKISGTTASFTPPPEGELFEIGDAYELGWFADVASTNVLESPICSGTDADVEVVYKMGEEEESLFADLGELPECSVVFRPSLLEPEETNRLCNFSVVPCYGSTGPG
ncbi:WRKY domain-containing protein [Cephalotus follicularis]|uniref:WRKY domain-containing protein n=1 Tax=Cephalotus follicularis TaxID=3775 RepID=A0A1Q3AZ91_CEPFO|nr:WRKY domain-containing protein [Cephalotus follicularis]